VTPAASRPGTCAAAAIAAAILLFPHGGSFAVLAYVLAPLAGVWIEIKARNQRLTYAQGALLGFRSSFYGMFAAPAGLLGVKLFARRHDFA